ncbi:hypothetical protein Baya_17089 [Bagarius yarrelli]|uniref:Uncharacterized protein n=1 Tax=Bagarius yarrelli TaxID=175774 RepID=A0A556VXC8_BAGYA|nr:hypothetical protein Baya_17089 [Bagarius yarrelli]
MELEVEEEEEEEEEDFPQTLSPLFQRSVSEDSAGSSEEPIRRRNIVCSWMPAKRLSASEVELPDWIVILSEVLRKAYSALRTPPYTINITRWTLTSGTVGRVCSVVPEPWVNGRPATCVNVANSNNTEHPPVPSVGGAKTQTLPRTRLFATHAKGDVIRPGGGLYVWGRERNRHDDLLPHRMPECVHVECVKQDDVALDVLQDGFTCGVCKQVEQDRTERAHIQAAQDAVLSDPTAAQGAFMAVVEDVSVSLEPDSAALPVPEEPKQSPSGGRFLLYFSSNTLFLFRLDCSAVEPAQEIQVTVTLTEGSSPLASPLASQHCAAGVDQDDGESHDAVTPMDISKEQEIVPEPTQAEVDAQKVLLTPPTKESHPEPFPVTMAEPMDSGASASIEEIFKDSPVLDDDDDGKVLDKEPELQKTPQPKEAKEEEEEVAYEPALSEEVGWSGRCAVSSPSWSPEHSEASEGFKNQQQLQQGEFVWTARLVNEGLWKWAELNT